MPTKAVRKYLESHAEPEIRLAESFDRTYESALVVPVHDEDVGFLDGLAPALRDRTVLAVLVVNATIDAPLRVRRANQVLLAALRERLDALPAAGRARGRDAPPANEPPSTLPPAWRGAMGRADMLVVDRASPPFALPSGEGVGLARKIGADLAVALHATERLSSGWIQTTDADVVLPPDYFTPPPSDGAVAGIHPFWHSTSGDPALDRATALYEIALRTYVLGLRWAGSPYAFHTIGSTLAVTAEAYAAVRGFPRRQAGEDFYLLDKLAKLGPIATLAGEPVRIHPRRSSRVPFGTGPAVERILREEARGRGPVLYHPQCFAALRHWLHALDELSDHRDVRRWDDQIHRVEPAALREPLLAFAAGLRSVASRRRHDVLTALCRQHAAGVPLRSHLHAWFDAFSTLKLVHAVRDGGFPSLPWQRALRSAPYVDLPSSSRGTESPLSSDSVLRGTPDGDALDEIRSALAWQERTGPPRTWVGAPAG
jgi:hypothetical protein